VNRSASWVDVKLDEARTTGSLRSRSLSCLSVWPWCLARVCEPSISWVLSQPVPLWSVRPQIDALNVSAGQAHALMAAEVSVPAVRLLLLYRGGFAGLVSLTSQKWMCRWVTVTGVSLGPRIW
jgi:hypothetical protein